MLALSGGEPMGDVYTVWHELETRRSAIVTRRRVSFALAVGLLLAMAASEVVFLRYFIGPDDMGMRNAAEGISDQL